MKRIVVYILSLAAAMMVPLEGTDVGKLQPVELVQIYKEGDFVVIATDTGDSGQGRRVEAAFEDLEETTAGIIFLDTADYLLVSASAIGEVPALQNYLKSDVRVCKAEKGIDLVQAAEFLKVHPPRVKLKEPDSVRNAQTLTQENDRVKLSDEKDEKRG